MARVISGHQPSYLPWLGYIAKIMSCDAFVLMDDVQFARRDFMHKNMIVTKEGPLLLSIPISKSQDDLKILEVKIAKTAAFMSRNDWQYQHLNSIRHAYRRAPYFTQIFPDIEKIYTSSQYTSLIEVTDAFLAYILNVLSLPSSRIVRMSKDLGPTSALKDKLVLDHCLELRASSVLFGSHGKDYVDVAAFLDQGIEVLFQDFKHPVYQQHQTGNNHFIGNACFIDALMNLGCTGFAKLVDESFTK